MSDLNCVLSPNGDFELANYNRAKLFAGFLPGISGEKAVPSWAFYINRGQCMAGFGIQDKDGAIQEYVPADKAPWYTAWRGFRTFIKVNPPGGHFVYEPFRFAQKDSKIRNKLSLNAASLNIGEFHEDLGLEVKITYFTLPGEKIGGLFRKTELINHNPFALNIETVDGLAVIMPSGYTNYLAKNMGATIRAWMNVEFVRETPYYKLKCRPDDVTELVPINSGNFYFGYTIENGNIQPVKYIYDPAVIFGEGTDFQPVRFMELDFSFPKEQSRGNNLPSAFGYIQSGIPAGGSLVLYGLYGYSPNPETLAAFLPRIDRNFYQSHWEQNNSLIQAIQDYAFTNSGDPLFARYIGRCFLDNVMRGGLPVTLAGKNTVKPKVFWLYSRKHGDLERDYNDFQLSPTYYSQGNGNFRDINQNRRNDIWFNPDVGDQALRYFWNLIRLDGYNPLVVKGTEYIIEDLTPIKAWMAQNSIDVEEKVLQELIGKAFTPGSLAVFLEDKMQLTGGLMKNLFELIIANARDIECAKFGEGYWVDHWTYNLDLIDSFQGIFPERLLDVCLKRRDYTFYDNWELPVPSNRRFYFINGVVRQRQCIETDPEKKALIAARKEDPFIVRTNFGAGEIYHTNLFIKMLVLALNKLTSFDPYCSGLEMDAGKPGWCDALNGLPELLGSSVNEAFALKRLIEKLIMILGLVPEDEVIVAPVEILCFMNGLAPLLNCNLIGKEERYHFWEASHRVRDKYLSSVRLGISGEETRLSPEQVNSFLSQSLKMVKQALQRAYQPETGLYHTYFYYRVTRWRNVKVDFTDWELAELKVWPIEFERETLPEFLEGQVAALRVETDPRKKRELYGAVRKSRLYDRQLGMYKICTDLTNAPDEIGRIKVFPRGWLENESIFLHMEYKYLLEMLRSGLYEEFFTELPKLLVCYQKAEVYGRNPLENSSFIVSGAYPEAKLHGSGFVARLSGSNAEMIHIWLYMSFGPDPFSITEDGELELEFKPVLTERFFCTTANRVNFLRDGQIIEYHLPANSYAAKFLGNTLVIYHNPNRKNTFGPGSAIIKKMNLTATNGETISVSGAKLSGDWARKVREGAVERIDLFMI